MSYEVTITIRCDEPGCTTGIRYTQANRGGLSKTFAGYRAQQAGWEIPGHAMSADPKRARCPKHAKEKA